MWKDIILFVHIAAAAVWAGSGVTLIAQVRNARSTGGIPDAVRAVQSIQWLDKRLYPATPLLTVAAGIAMVIMDDAWSFSDLWVYLALAFFVVSAVSAGVIGGKAAKEMEQLAEDGEIESPAMSAAFNRLMRANDVDMLFIAGMLALMVFKPVL